MAGVVHIPWYATFFRADKLEPALAEIAAVSLRYGATGYHVYRSRDDRYRFHQFTAFDEKIDWERYWFGDEFAQFRSRYSSWYQVPVVYEWNDVVAEHVLGQHANGAGETVAHAQGGAQAAG
jgi:hypothetical protein